MSENDSTDRKLIEQYEIYADVSVASMAMAYVRVNRTSNAVAAEQKVAGD